MIVNEIVMGLFLEHQCPPPIEGKEEIRALIWVTWLSYLLLYSCTITGAWGTGWRRKSWLPLLVFVICICLDLVYLSEKNALSKSLGVYGRGSLEALVDWSSMSLSSMSVLI